MANVLQLKDQRFGKLIVLNRNGSNKRGEALWLCLCDCGNTISVKSYNLTRNKVKSCGCLPTGIKRNDDGYINHTFNDITITSYDSQDKHRGSVYNYQCKCGKFGKILKSNVGKTQSCAKCGDIRRMIAYGGVPGWYYHSVRAGAKNRNLEFDLTTKDLWDLFVKQNGFCNYTGRLIELKFNIEDRKIQTASLDRIDSNLGYIINNVHWIHRSVNYIKNNIPHEDFIAFCTEIYKWDMIKKENKCLGLDQK